ncbi:hypothetical protein MATL_G00256270 [Megalops atlanticus]|uniref:Ig-like domain-containing protein n=1 Tax=Megalops atlanticus TaxID=7932 RepID=A0A9D3PBH6_MEGAT|nr:hypothetical protein MATL_G00256270 [Megalops atlanticus]
MAALVSVWLVSSLLHMINSCTLSNSEPKEVTGYTGGSVILPCSCSDPQATPQKLQWRAADRDWTDIFPPNSPNMDPQYRDRVQVLNSASPGNMSLLLSNLTESDEGTYRCETGDQNYKDIQLCVEGCSLSDSGPNEVTGYIGGSVILPCSCSDIQRKPQNIKWFVFNKHSTVIFPPNSPDVNPRYRARVQVLNSASPGNISLLLSNLTESDTGAYRCTIGPGMNKEIKLSVKAEEETRKLEPQQRVDRERGGPQSKNRSQRIPIQ